MGNPFADWLKRHRNAANFWLHMMGMPACFVIAPVMLILRQWWMAAAMFTAGYMLQFVGHLVERNRSGEQMLLRRILGKKK